VGGGWREEVSLARETKNIDCGVDSLDGICAKELWFWRHQIN
jgi:hypothetical protein